MPPCLTLSIIRYGSRVKWSNPGKGVAPSPTPWCSSYRKGSLRVTLDYGRQLYFTFIYISILCGKPLKLTGKFTYLDSSISSTESDVIIHLTKAWTTIDRLSSIWKSDLSDKLKLDVFQDVAVSILLYGCITSTSTEYTEKKLEGTIQECLKLFWATIGSNTLRNNICTATYLSSQKHASKMSVLDMTLNNLMVRFQ